MKGSINIENISSEGILTIDIEGVIGLPEQMQFEESGSRISTYDSLRTLLDRVREDTPRAITVNIRSTGGSVNDALLIYDTLKECGAEVTTRCYGYAASAATIIAQAASTGQREISSNCLYLIHNSSCETEGNSKEIEATIEMLKQTDERIAAIYTANSGRPQKEFAGLMAENGGKGRWISPEEVLARGLADTIIGHSRLGRKDRKLVRNLGLPPVPSGNIISRIIETIDKNLGQLLDRANDRKPGIPVKTEDGILENIDRRETAKNEKARAEFSENKKPLDISVAEDIRKDIQPSATKQKEDPSIQGMKRSYNQEAYFKDLKNIKRE